jgi:asparagine synthase (glutamine-hydrolysing)
VSGIAGIYLPDGSPVPWDLESMLRSLAHRGPDRAGTWIDGPVGLAHAMLWNSPESLQEHQPLCCADAGLCLTADARLDNREDLSARLQSKGITLRSDTDAELILRAYEAWGEDCPAQLLGDFAFAIWDGKRQQMFCARDPVGVKPFQYCLHSGVFSFATEPKAMFASGALSRKANVGTMCLFLLGRLEPEETFDQGVHRLPGGHCMVVRQGQVRKWRYWHIDPGRTITHRTDEEYAEAFRDLFSDCVRARMRCHGPVGVLLSGGLDSSSIACVGQATRPPNGLEAFSVGFAGQECDESGYINDVIRTANIQGNLIQHNPASEWLDPNRGRQDPDLWFFPTLFVLGPPFQKASDQGLRAMVDGIGGDDLLAASCLHLADLLRRGRLLRLWRQLRDDSATTGFSRLNMFLHCGIRPAIPPRLRRFIRTMLGRGGYQLPDWIDPDAVQESGAMDRLEAGPPPSPQFPSLSQQKMYDELTHGWNTTVAIALMDAFSARLSMESRHPFFDRRLIEFLLAVPEEQRWQGAWPKTILRRAMQGVLPESIRMRQSKAEFTFVVDQTYRVHHLAQVRELFRTPHLAESGIIRPEQFRKLLETYLQGKASPQEEVACMKVIALELRCRATESSSIQLTKVNHGTERSTP